MRNVLKILKRDLLRLLKTPQALVVVFALMVIPSLYTWYNVIGFWNPYDNTGNLTVCVVNQDAGGSSELTGELNVGERIVDQLHENNQLHWEFTDYDAAMNELKSGRAYAAYVIPEHFTADLLTITTGSFTQPKIEYYVNEKSGPVAPKITDTGATTLDETINSTFVATVSDVVVKTIDEKYITDHYEMRILLESEAAKRAAQRGMPDAADYIKKLEALQRHMDSVSTEEYEELNLAVHSAIWTAADNERLYKFLSSLWNGPSVGIASPKLDHYIKSTQEHIDILKAIQKQDAKAAQKEMAKHIERSLNNILKNFKFRT